MVFLLLKVSRGGGGWWWSVGERMGCARWAYCTYGTRRVSTLEIARNRVALLRLLTRFIRRAVPALQFYFPPRKTSMPASAHTG